jgi:ribosomal protein S18 acetylase RimI-like enzyme
MVGQIGALVHPGLQEANRIAAIISEALKNDPLQCYFFRDEQEQNEIGPVLYRLIAKYGIRQENLLATSTEYEGVAYWETNHDRKLTGMTQVLSEGLRLLKAAGVPTLSRMVKAGSAAFRLRRRLVPFPHWYLGLLAVDPRHQRKGHASALLRPVLEKLERERMPCYLETHKTENVALYEHFGFRVLEELELPGSRIRQWCLLKSAGE